MDGWMDGLARVGKVVVDSMRLSSPDESNETLQLTCFYDEGDQVNGAILVFFFWIGFLLVR